MMLRNIGALDHRFWAIIRPGDKTRTKSADVSHPLYAQEMAAVALRQQATAPGASPGERAAAVTKAVSVLGLNYPSAELAEWAEKTLELTSTPEGGAIVLGLTRTPHHEPQDTAAFARGGLAV